MIAIQTSDLTKHYKETVAVQSLNLLVNQGELFALLGVNGAGKTTTIKMLTCLVKPTGGDARILGNSVTTAAHVSRATSRRAISVSTRPSSRNVGRSDFGTTLSGKR